MCGRFTLVQLSDFTNMFPWIFPPDSPPPPRYNIAPTQEVPVVPNEPMPKVEFYRWGLIPSWATGPEIGNRMINARAETLATKPAFRRVLESRRCLVPADGFYEWRTGADGKTRTPLYVTLKSRRPFAFAGLWDTWRDPAGAKVRTFTIITTPPNDLLRPIHNRMPAILRESDYQRWLDPEKRPPPQLQALLAPFAAEEMIAQPVSRLVNDPKVDVPECIESVADEPPPQPSASRRRKPKPPPQPTLFS